MNYFSNIKLSVRMRKLFKKLLIILMLVCVFGAIFLALKNSDTFWKLTTTKMKSLGFTECSHGFDPGNYNNWSELRFEKGKNTISFFKCQMCKWKNEPTLVSIIEGSCPNKAILLKWFCTHNNIGPALAGNTKIWEMSDEKNNMSFYQLGSEDVLYDDLGKTIPNNLRKFVPNNLQKGFISTCSEIVK